PTAVSLVVQVPVTGVPPADAVSCTDVGWPCTTMFGPPAAVIVAPPMPHTEAELPSFVPKEAPLSSPPPPLLASELTRNEPPCWEPHAGATTASASVSASASVRVSRRMTNPSRPSRSTRSAQTDKYHASFALQPGKLV